MARDLLNSSRDIWAERISEAWGGQVEGILATGTMLAQAREELPHGEWGVMVAESLPFSLGTAQRLIAIAEDDRLTAHGPLLPPSWRTLYELTKLSNAELAHLVDEGILNPEMERADIAKAFKVERRAEREIALATKIKELPAERFGVIVADPEWEWEPWGPGGMDRAAENHYPTSPIDAILARDVGALAAPDCVMFLWATVPMLPQALAAMAHWGFEYKSHWIWLKDREGTGYWNRNVHELLLIGTVGAIPAPAPGTQPASVIAAPLGEHSAKPELFLELIEAYFPNLPKIELNARGPGRPGWTVWGNEAEGEVA